MARPSLDTRQILDLAVMSGRFLDFGAGPARLRADPGCAGGRPSSDSGFFVALLMTCLLQISGCCPYAPFSPSSALSLPGSPGVVVVAVG